MLSALIAFTLLLAPATPSSPRSAFSSCLNKLVKSSLEKKIGQSDFDAQLPAACANEEDAFRKSVVATDMKNGISRKTSEQGVSEEIADYISSTKDRYREEAAAGG